MQAGDYSSFFQSLLKPQSLRAVVQEPRLSGQVVLRAHVEPGPGLMAPSHPTTSEVPPAHKASGGQSVRPQQTQG